MAAVPPWPAVRLASYTALKAASLLLVGAGAILARGFAGADSALRPEALIAAGVVGVIFHLVLWRLLARALERAPRALRVSVAPVRVVVGRVVVLGCGVTAAFLTVAQLGLITTIAIGEAVFAGIVWLGIDAVRLRAWETRNRCVPYQRVSGVRLALRKEATVVLIEE